MTTRFFIKYVRYHCYSFADAVEFWFYLFLLRIRARKCHFCRRSSYILPGGAASFIEVAYVGLWE